MTWVTPPFISERQAGTWVDCTDCSAVMAVDGHQPGRAPATLAEAKALRTESGFPATGGTTVEGIAKGVKLRYGLTPLIIGSSFSSFWSALAPGRVAFAIIKVGDAPTGPLRRYQGTFTGLHCDTFSRLDSTDRAWLEDPCGPTDGSYKGQWVNKSDIAASYRGSAGVLTLAVALTKKTLIYSAQARPNATFGASFGTIAKGTVIGVTGSVTGSKWTSPTGATGTKWYIAATINGKAVSSVYPGHTRVWVYAGAIQGG